MIIVMSVIEKISRMSNSGCDDDVLMNYIQENFDILECESNGDEYEEPKKHDYNFCKECNLEMLIDYRYRFKALKDWILILVFM